MPKLGDISLDDAGKSLQGFQYTNISVEKLEASEYTIVQAVIDKSGSVFSYKDDLEKMIGTVVDACKKNQRADNLLMRTTAFSSIGFSGVSLEELHGFSTLDVIDPNKYVGTINPDGGTPLFQATAEAVGALIDFGQKLYKKRFLCNAILFIITDGEDNASNVTPEDVKKMIDKMKTEKIIESFRVILVGVNDIDCKPALEDFKNRAVLDEYISMGNVTPGKLAKLAQFVSQSVSSQSQALGSGGASQPIDFKF